MTTRQKITLEQSEKRQRLNEILAKDTKTPEERAELETLTKRMQELEPELRAAIVAEGEEETRAAAQFGDGETAERRALLRRVTLADYVTAATARMAPQGAAAELNAALDVKLVGDGGGVLVPWAALLGVETRALDFNPETRAFTTTGNNDGPEMQRPILQRLFGPGVMDLLGVRMDSVPVGRSEWPLLTGAASPSQVKEGVAVGAAPAATFAYANLKPKRLTGNYEFTHEMAASVPDIEGALRRDLADAVKASMAQSIINGTAPDATNPQHVEGFLTALTATDLGTGQADAAAYGGLHSQGVDGIHAGTEREVTSVIGDETYQHAAKLYITGSGEAGSELLSRRSGGCMASTYIPDIASKKQTAILHSAGPNGGGVMRGDSVAALWPTLEIVRDNYTKASQGVILTWVSLWDAKVAFRSAAYRAVAIQVQA